MDDKFQAISLFSSYFSLSPLKYDSFDIYSSQSIYSIFATLYFTLNEAKELQVTPKVKRYAAL